MNNPTKKSRVTILLILILAGLVILLCILISPDRLSPPHTDSSTNIIRAEILPPATTVFVPSAPATNSVNTPEPVIPEVSTPTFADSPTLYYAHSQHLQLPPSFVASDLSSSNFGIVDLDRLIATLHPDTNSPDARAALLYNIMRAVRDRAQFHKFEFVLDSSARSSNQTPLILYTNGVSDLTDEVLAQLSQ